MRAEQGHSNLCYRRPYRSARAAACVFSARAGAWGGMVLGYGQVDAFMRGGSEVNQNSSFYVTPCHYYVGEYTPYRYMLKSPSGTDIDRCSMLNALFQQVGVQSGDEIEITVRKTGNRHFGDRRIILQSSNTYDWETDEQMTQRMEAGA